MTPRILIVEDEAVVAEDLRRTLIRLGYEVPFVTGDGSEAVRLAETLQPSLVLMDIHLNGAIDGIDAASAIRAQQNVPVVFLTAYSDDATLHRAKLAEPSSYLVKPFDERELRTSIELGLYLHRISRERDALLDRVRHQERLASLGTLAAGLAHEINNPLAVILLGSELAQAAQQGLEESIRGADGVMPEWASDDLGTMRDSLGDIKTASHRIASIVGDFKRFARSESHKAGPINPVHIVEAAVGLFRRSLEERAHLTVESSPTPMIKASESLMVQVLLNLLSNAAHALDGRPRDACEIHVRTGVAADGRVSISVRDNGVGIPAHLLQKIFDPFMTTKPVGTGTGLGLSISHGIVVSHGGEIVVETVEGAGTTMTVLLPAVT